MSSTFKPIELLINSLRSIPNADSWFSEHLEKAQCFLNQYRRGAPNERVKIAVLDTGLDMDHLILRQFRENKQIGPEKSRDFTSEPNKEVAEDKTGHGTHCTHLILKTCPTVEVYMARVFVKAKADQTTVGKIAKV